MKAVTAYEACDGMVFNSREDCLKHESQLVQNTSSKAKLKMWSCDFTPLTNYDEHDYLACAYVYVGDEEAVEIFKIGAEAAEQISEGVDKPGFYYYTDLGEIALYENECGKIWAPCKQLMDQYFKRLDWLVSIQETLDLPKEEEGEKEEKEDTKSIFVSSGNGIKVNKTPILDEEDEALYRLGKLDLDETVQYWEDKNNESLF